jgi:hypothetical protein
MRPSPINSRLTPRSRPISAPVNANGVVAPLGALEASVTTSDVVLVVVAAEDPDWPVVVVVGDGVVVVVVGVGDEPVTVIVQAQALLFTLKLK